jgi:hypothetical protein
MNAGPGKTKSAIPISRTVAPTTETITRLATLIFSVLQMPERRFIHDVESLDRSLRIGGVM